MEQWTLFIQMLEARFLKGQTKQLSTLFESEASLVGGEDGMFGMSARLSETRLND